jgi:transposase
MENSWMSDARKIPDEVMSYLRKIAVKAVNLHGYSPETVIEVLDLSRSCIYDWLNRFDEGGYDALDTCKAPGMPAMITPVMEKWLSDTVINLTPEDFGYDTQLWTCEILAEILSGRFLINVKSSTVNQHLKDIGLSYQKPRYRPLEQDDDEVERFLNEKFPMIQELAIRIGADIGFEDESGVDLRQHSGKTWGAVGKTPEVIVTGKRGNFNVLSVVTNDGKLQFSIKDQTINSDVYIDFLGQLIRNREKPLILFTDHASFHKSKKVRTFVRSNRNKIRIYFFPKYSPELNPDEQVWEEIKDNRIGRQPVKNKADLKKKLNSALRSLQHNVSRVKSFFQLPETKYASLV